MADGSNAAFPSQYKWGLLGALYFSQGLPFGFFTQSLPAVLREQEYSLGVIGLSSLLAIPWALKFLWAPFVDRTYKASVGRRRSWILPLQFAAIVAVLSLVIAPEALGFVLCVVFLLNLLSATQDIATDGLAVELLSHRERGFGNGLQVAGYRVGMVTGGGALLIAYGELGPRTTFLIMAGCMALATIPALLFDEPRYSPTASAPAKMTGTSGRSPEPNNAAVPMHFLRQPGAWALLALITTYKFGDALGTAMLRPFLVDFGLSITELGWVLGTVGFTAGLLGALVGGGFVGVLGRRRALLLFGVVQAASIAGYAYLTIVTPSMPLLYALCSFEHFAGGMATAALFTCMMDWSRKEAAAADYTVQASAVVIVTGLASAISGFSAEWLGYGAHFILATCLSLLAVGIAALLFPRSDFPPRNSVSSNANEGASL